MEQIHNSVFDRRLAARSESRIDTLLCGVEWRPFRAEIRNVSTNGALLLSAGRLIKGEQITLALPGVGLRPATVARGNRWLGYGCKFDVPLSVAQIAILRVNGRSEWVPIGRVKVET